MECQVLSGADLEIAGTQYIGTDSWMSLLDIRDNLTEDEMFLLAGNLALNS